ASVTHLNPQGCASAALPPMMTTRSVFLMSVQEFVIAPRPNVGARLATVGPCQTLAWLSNANIPVLRTTLYVAHAVSLLVADAARKPVVSHRFTVTPSLFLTTIFLSRSSFIRRAMRSSATSQDTRSNLSEPALRICG